MNRNTRERAVIPGATFKGQPVDRVTEDEHGVFHLVQVAGLASLRKVAKFSLNFSINKQMTEEQEYRIRWIWENISD